LQQKTASHPVTGMFWRALPTVANLSTLYQESRQPNTYHVSWWHTGQWPGQTWKPVKVPWISAWAQNKPQRTVIDLPTRFTTKYVLLTYLLIILFFPVPWEVNYTNYHMLHCIHWQSFCQTEVT